MKTLVVTSVIVFLAGCSNMGMHPSSGYSTSGYSTSGGMDPMQAGSSGYPKNYYDEDLFHSYTK